MYAFTNQYTIVPILLNDNERSGNLSIVKQETNLYEREDE